jgi:hypothetical protein
MMQALQQILDVRTKNAAVLVAERRRCDSGSMLQYALCYADITPLSVAAPLLGCQHYVLVHPHISAASTLF